MSTPGEVQREIDEIDAMLANAAAEEEESFALRIANDGLRHRRAALAEELATPQTPTSTRD